MIVNDVLSRKMRAMSFFMAILVVMIHVPFTGIEGSWGWLLTSIIIDGIARIAVPYFFVVAGFFLAAHVGERNWWFHEVRKRFYSLILPLLLVNAGWLLFCIVMRILPNILHMRPLFEDTRIDLLLWEGITSFGAYGQQPLLYNVLGGVPSALGLNPFTHPFLIQTWFLRSLFLLVCISPIIVLGGRWSMVIAFIVHLLLCPFSTTEHPPLEMVFHMTFSLEGLLYFTIGMMLNLRPFVRLKCNIRWMGLIFILSIGVLALTFLFRPALGVWCGYVMFFIKPIMLACCWELLPSCRLPEFVTALAFPIYLFHLCAFRLLGLFLHCQAASVLSWLLLVFEIVALSIVMAYLIRKMTPRFTRILFGMR